MAHQTNPSQLFGSFSGVVSGPTEAIVELMFGPKQHDAHCKDYRWHLRVVEFDFPAREAAVRAEAEKMIAEVRARRNGGSRLQAAE